MLPVIFDRILVLNIYSNSFIFGTQFKGCLLLALSHSAGEASGVSFPVRNGEVIHPRLQSLLALLLKRQLCTKLCLKMVPIGKEFNFSLGKSWSSHQSYLE